MGHSIICSYEDMARAHENWVHRTTNGYTPWQLVQITDVVAYIEQKAADIRKDCEERGVTCFTTPYPERGKDFINAYEYEKHMAFGEYSDIFKEVHGYRPTISIKGVGLHELEDSIGRLHEMADTAREKRDI